MKKVYFFLLIASMASPSCKPEAVPPDDSLEILMLALVHLPVQFPLDFVADEVVGDYKPSTGLLRVTGKMVGTNDKIELRIRDTGNEVEGEYNIGDFSLSDTNVKAEFLDGTNAWNARSLSGTFIITKFEPSQTAKVWFLSGTFSFRAKSGDQEFDITQGEIKNALILEES
ncbi:MAG: hypothetical protein SF052_26070 [Bacteroidia bacterium]|nr:hypothetical protein [Bacteroidia bacterium]